MQVVIVKKGMPVTKRRCKLCHNPPRPGEVVLSAKLAARAYQDTSFVMHKFCLLALLEGSPDGDTPVNVSAQIQALREYAIAAGAH